MEILITGASTGIGWACAERFSQKGHRVWVGVRSEKDFARINEKNDLNLQPLILDVTDEVSVNHAFQKIQSQSVTLDCLINNAGVVVSGPIETLALKEWKDQYEVNFFGLIRVTQKFLPMLRKSQGRIVNMSSISGKISIPWMVPYASSKFALEALSDGLRRELKNQKIKVISVNPGPIQTPIWEKSIQKGQSQMEAIPREFLEIYEKDLLRFQELVFKSRDSASPVRDVVCAVEKAVFKIHPAARYYVGRSSSITALLARLLPDRILDFLVSLK